MQSYHALSTLALQTLHLEIRTQILFALHASFKSTYVLDAELNEPEPSIIALNTTLVAFDTEVSTYIPPAQYAHITTGLAPLMDRYCLELSTHIAAMNANGCALMQLNILVLQQNLKNVEEKAELPFSALFFDLFTAGPDAIVARAKKHGKGFGVGGDGFGYETVKRLMELCYSERLGSERREVGVAARRALDAQLLEISEFLY